MRASFLDMDGAEGLECGEGAGDDLARGPSDGGQFQLREVACAASLGDGLFLLDQGFGEARFDMEKGEIADDRDEMAQGQRETLDGGVGHLWMLPDEAMQLFLAEDVDGARLHRGGAGGIGAAIERR